MSRPLALITGIRGQDGALLAGHLLARDWLVVGLARPRRRAGARDSLKSQLLERCTIIDRDITEADVLEDAVADLSPTAVFHLAAAHHSSEGDGEPEDERIARMTAVNFVACERLLRAIVRASPDTRLVFASSSQIWTPRYVAELADEETARAPATYYGLTKSWAMDCIGHFRERLGVHAASAILFNHESPHRTPSFVARKIALAAARAAMGGSEILELRNIGAAADWSAAEDIVSGLHAMAEALAPRDLVLASGKGRCVRDLLDIAYASVGLDWTAHVRAAGDHAAPYLIGAIERAHRCLGWRPQIDLATVVEQMVRADRQRLESSEDADLMSMEGP